MMIGADSLRKNSGIFNGERMRYEDMIELRTGERVRDMSAQRIREFVLDEMLLDARAFTTVEQSVGQTPAKYPVERGDVRLLKNIEITTDDRGSCRIALGHCTLEFLHSPRGLGEDEVEAEYAYRYSAYVDVGVESPTVPDF